MPKARLMKKEGLYSSWLRTLKAQQCSPSSVRSPTNCMIPQMVA